MFIGLLLFLPLVLSSSLTQDTVIPSDAPKITTTTKIQIHQNPTTAAVAPPILPLKPNDSESIGKRLAAACYKHQHEEQGTGMKLTTFIMQCLLQKKPKNLTAIEHQWEFCCRLRQSCHDGPSSDHKCSDIFCDCLDLVDLATEPSKSVCRSNVKQMDGICGEDLDPFPNRYVNIYENVGFGAIYGKNLVFGTAGWICMAIILTIFLSATAYLIVSYVQFKCNKVTKEVIATKEVETYDAYSQPLPPPPQPQRGATKKFHDKVILKA